MEIHYNSKADLLYLRLDAEEQPVINRRVSEYVVLDLGEDDTIVGIEIMDASRRLKLEQLLPVIFGKPLQAA
jgi:uncharacterized protein YuzE